MNYSTLIQIRKSVRAFTDKKVPLYTTAPLREYHNNSVTRLIPSLKTELLIFGDDAVPDLPAGHRAVVSCIL